MNHSYNRVEFGEEDMMSVELLATCKSTRQLGPYSSSMDLVQAKLPANLAQSILAQQSYLAVSELVVAKALVRLGRIRKTSPGQDHPNSSQ